ncbi:hypothetical protein ENKNEFLB_01939 [Nocardioides aquaticus]|uniref:Uncharacterized protein n=1 Tax=Nocardioides aquaticus TaxID=160826 RepID=A0ABX8EGX0_9ACTN|nr:hypothetical protein [Nocardioides aquaticus]QVT79556.1 hypothetical protein ENKNEFLB_01939 [Nocardioides aquaticus]
MPTQDLSDRFLIASIAANSRWAQETDRAAATRPARDAFERRFLDEVDPDRSLPDGERARRAENARKAYFHRLALKSAQARRRVGVA